MLACGVCAAGTVEKPRAGIPASDVRLLAGPFLDAQKRDLDYLLELEPDRLLSGMRAAAGLKPKAPLYGGWEKNGSGIVGHYLSACSWMFAATGDVRMKQRVDYIVGEMAAYQNHRGDGGLYASPWEANRWYAALGQGEAKFDNVLPWYVAHKTLASLRDAWITGGNPEAKDVLLKYADWCAAITSKLTDAQWREMTGKEFGAPNEIFAELFAATGNTRYLDLAKRFSKEPMVSALERNETTILHNRHANTEIPLFTGYQKIHEACGEERWHRAAVNFRNAVLSGQTFAFGGNSIREAFINPAEAEQKLTDICGPETCNTYNMLKLVHSLDEEQPDMKNTDYIERALFNHILTSIGPAPEGGFAYYTPTRPGHYKRYSKPFDAFWCCVGSGMENHARYGSYIYSAEKDRLLVNLFIPSQMRWREKGISVRQTTTFPESGAVILTVQAENPAEFTLSVRCPKWTETGEVRINGQTLPDQSTPGTWLDVKRVWKSGDALQVHLPPRLTAEFTSGGKFVSFFHGPVLLAAPLGTAGLVAEDFEADGSAPFIQLGRKEMDLQLVPKVQGGRDAVPTRVGPWKKPGVSYPLTTTGGSVPLVPFYRIGRERYAVYFPVSG